MGEYFTFSGRLNRQPYWLRTLALYGIMLAGIVIAFLIAGGLDAFSDGDAGAGFGTGLILAGILVVVLFIAILIPSLAVQVRRLHDRNKSGWWLLFFFVVPGIVEGVFTAFGEPTVALIGSLIGFGISIWYLVELGILRGTDGPNRYGPDPLGYDETSAQIFA